MGNGEGERILWTDLPAASPMPLSPIGDKGFFQVKAEE